MSILSSMSTPRIHFQGGPQAGGSPVLVYSALFLPEESNFLKSIPLPAGWKQFAHHCTLQHKNDGPLKSFPELEGSLDVIEIRQTPEVIYAVVKPPESVLTWFSTQGLATPPWHITIGTAPGVPPSRARTMAEQGNTGMVVQSFAPPRPLAFHSGAFTNRQEVIHQMPS